MLNSDSISFFQFWNHAQSRQILTKKFSFEIILLGGQEKWLKLDSTKSNVFEQFSQKMCFFAFYVWRNFQANFQSAPDHPIKNFHLNVFYWVVRCGLKICLKCFGANNKNYMFFLKVPPKKVLFCGYQVSVVFADHPIKNFYMCCVVESIIVVITNNIILRAFLRPFCHAIQVF